MAEPDPYPTELDLRAAFRRYLEDAPTQVRPAELARHFATTHPHRRSPIGPWGPAMVLRPAWALLLVAALLAVTVSAVFVGSMLLRPTNDPEGILPPALVPTPTVTPSSSATPADGPFAPAPVGVDELRPAQEQYGTIVADGDGILWAHDFLGSRIVRYDPTTGSTVTWAVGYEAIPTIEIAPARAGGVWLVGPRALRRFDGTDIREAIQTPSEVDRVTEARNGDLWAVASDALLQWNGTSWSRLDVRRPASKPASSGIEVVTVDADGHPWIGWTIQDAGNNATGLGWLAHHDGTAWITYDASTLPPLGGRVWAITQAPEGTMWVATARGLARFDGSTWTDATAWPDSGYPGTLSVAVGPDGAVWAATNDPDDTATVRRFDGTSWTSYGTADGVPGGPPTTAVLPVEGGTYLGAASGIYRLTGSRWERWPAVASAPASPALLDGTRMLAISREELWTTGEDGAWHFQAGSWTKEPIDPAHPGSAVSSLALAPDGTVWAAGDDGVAYRRDGRWVVADSTSATVITIDRDGVAWVAGGVSGCEIWTVRSIGGAWSRTPLTTGRLKACVGGTVISMAVDGRGTLWVGTGGYVADGLASYADGRWAEYYSFAGLPRARSVSVLGIAPNGDPWIAAKDWTAHFDGTAWTVIRGPEGTAAADQALGLSSPAWELAQQLGTRAVAPDGTVFALETGRLLRLPASSPSP